ncbi:hypothetical protein GTY81_11665 [Streptomyces sp. SID8366]|uniref:hypothetical protein n=1 Tax=unclassified Streptomyces TaxID=2593676 RepID=UPI0011B93B33|nr:hypothetical protein [Streptomyces sp. PsTaAH-130]MYU04531.1 hypothetical protein [Streptomyces sp. SID8366]MYU66413.1 hypothetical protein [Streptomyces sp. SID69]
MFSELTGEELYAEMIMQRTNDARNFLVVEGDGDIAVIDRYLAQDRFTVIPAHGKKTAHEALALVFADNFSGVYSILDRDWLELIPGDLRDARIVHTDSYDLDMSIFLLSDIYVSVASSYCIKGGYRVSQLGCSEEEIRKACVTMAFPVGVLRFISERDRLELRMRDFPLHEVVDRSNLKVDIDLLVSTAIGRSKKASANPQGVKNALQVEMAGISDEARYCSGHDIARAFSVLIKERWSTIMSTDSVERTARAAVSWEKLKSLSIYSDSARWFSGDTRMVWIG